MFPHRNINKYEVFSSTSWTAVFIHSLHAKASRDYLGENIIWVTQFLSGKDQHLKMPYECSCITLHSESGGSLPNLKASSSVLWLAATVFWLFIFATLRDKMLVRYWSSFKPAASYRATSTWWDTLQTEMLFYTSCLRLDKQRQLKKVALWLNLCVRDFCSDKNSEGGACGKLLAFKSWAGYLCACCCNSILPS